MPAADHTEWVHVDHSDASRLSAGGEESMGQFSALLNSQMFRRRAYGSLFT